MPIIKSAKKKLRKDVRKMAHNTKYRKQIKKIVKEVKKSGKGTSVSAVYRAFDAAVKKGVIHKNKASRMKSKLSKLLQKKK